MRSRPALAAAVALMAVLAPAASAAGPGTAGTTQVEGTSRIDQHTLRVVVKAPGDLTGADVQAQLGSQLAFVERVQRTGPRPSLHLVFAVDTSGSMSGQPITAAIAAGQRLLDAAGRHDQVGLVVFDDSARVVAPMTSNVRGRAHRALVADHAFGHRPLRRHRRGRTADRQRSAPPAGWWWCCPTAPTPRAR